MISFESSLVMKCTRPLRNNRILWWPVLTSLVICNSLSIPSTPFTVWSPFKSWFLPDTWRSLVSFLFNTFWALLSAILAVFSSSLFFKFKFSSKFLKLICWSYIFTSALYITDTTSPLCASFTLICEEFSSGSSSFGDTIFTATLKSAFDCFKTFALSSTENVETSVPSKSRLTELLVDMVRLKFFVDVDNSLVSITLGA